MPNVVVWVGGYDFGDVGWRFGEVSDEGDKVQQGVARTSDFFPTRLTATGSPFIELFNGVKRDLDTGRMMAACRSLPTIFWKILIGTVRGECI